MYIDNLAHWARARINNLETRHAAVLGRSLRMDVRLRHKLHGALNVFWMCFVRVGCLWAARALLKAKRTVRAYFVPIVKAKPNQEECVRCTHEKLFVFHALRLRRRSRELHVTRLKLCGSQQPRFLSEG